MVDVQPFRGWRYDLGQVGDLADVTAPPYDVINADEQTELYRKHACNVVRLILNRPEAGDDSPDAIYSRAAKFLRDWQQDGVLTQEREDAVYVYHQEFDWEGTHYNRRGVLARVRLSEFGEGQVFPHEQTMSGPKADRLALIKSCEANLSPVFGLYADPENAVQAALDVHSSTPIEVTDPLGVIHRIWPITDHAVINAVREILREQPVFIADGHHRYETALNYRRELREQGVVTDDQHPANFVLMMLVGMSDPGLAILPTHRLISGVPPLTQSELRTLLEPHFSIEWTGDGVAEGQAAWQLMEADGGQDVCAFGTSADGGWLLARLTDREILGTLAPDQSDDWRGLGVSILQKLVLEHILPAADGAKIGCNYVHLMEEVEAAMSQKTHPIACLVPPAGIEHVQEIASQLEKMPPKSTYFYPKLLSGLVFNPLR